MFTIEQRREPPAVTIRAALRRVKLSMLLVVLAVLWLFGIASTYALGAYLLLLAAAGASVFLLARLVGPHPIRGRVS